MDLLRTGLVGLQRRMATDTDHCIELARPIAMSILHLRTLLLLLHLHLGVPRWLRHLRHQRVLRRPSQMKCGRSGLGGTQSRTSMDQTGSTW